MWEKLGKPNVKKLLVIQVITLFLYYILLKLVGVDCFRYIVSCGLAYVVQDFLFHFFVLKKFK